MCVCVCVSIKGGGAPETRSGTVQSLKCCPCQQKRGARLPSAAPGSIKGGGPETRSGTVQSLKCCPCQQKTRREAPKCCAWQHQGGGPRKRARAPSRASSAAETSREAPKCCAWQHQGTRAGTVQSLKCCPCQQKRAARLPSAAPGSIKGGAPKRALAPSRA